MNLLRLAVLGPPEVFRGGSRLTFPLRKAQALLLYLAVEGDMHSRSKLATFLWPDSGPEKGRLALRNALVPLRRLLTDPEDAVPQHSHPLLSERDLLGLNPQASIELDLDVVQQAYQQAKLHSTLPSQEQRAALVTLVERALALVRGPFLDGFWLGEDSPFDEWREQQQQQWHMRLLLLLDRLSSWQDAAGELESARATLARWVTLDPLSEEAYRRLMRVNLAQGDATAALQVYTTLQARLVETLQITPSPETVALAEHSRALAARHQHSIVWTTTAESRPPSELVAPLLGRTAAFRQLVGSFEQARSGQPQAVLVFGEAGIGKTRLVDEFVAWARAQGAEVLHGHAFEIGGRLPYQPLVEALRERLEVENAPEDLLEDVWLAELSRVLPELRVRYPDLPTPTEDELTAKGRLFEAVARLLDALCQRAPLLLLVDDLQWADEASSDLLRYLGRSWKEQGSRALLLGAARSEELELNTQLSAQLVNLGRDLPVTQVSLQPLSRAETLQLIEALVGVGEHGTVRFSITGSGGSLLSEPAVPLVALGDFLFVQTGGQPLYLLETLKLLREREWLVPRRGADGTWRLEPSMDLVEAVGQEQSRRELLPPSVRALIQARLSKLGQQARQLVMASAVLGNKSSSRNLWHVTHIGVQAGVEALEEAMKSGLLHQEDGGIGRPSIYRFTHDLIRDVVYTELGEARRQVLHQRTLALLEREGARASELAYHARLSGEAEAAYRFSVQAGMEAVAVFAVADAIRHYEQARALLQEPQRIQVELTATEVEHLYAHLGQAYAFQNAWEKARETYKELLAYAQQNLLPTLISLTFNRLATLALQQSFDKPQIYALLEEALRVAETSHDQKALAETEWNWAQIIATVWDDLKGAMQHGTQALSLARENLDQDLEARCLSLLGYIHLLGGDFEEAVRCLEASLTLYTPLGTEPFASRELSLPSFITGASLTQSLTNRASGAFYWGVLAFSQVHIGQVQGSIRSGRKALALAQESKYVWVHVANAISLTYGFLDTGAYEEALVLTQNILPLAQTLPPTLIFHQFLTALGGTYQAVQQWEQARSMLEEAIPEAEMGVFKFYYVHILSRLCKHYGVAGEWGQARLYALQAIALRKSTERSSFILDFSFQHETEALLRTDDERQAREEVRRQGKHLGSHRRFRIPYLQSLAILAAWDGEREQAIRHLREAAQLATEIGLPAEQWQIQAALGSVSEKAGEQEQARTAFGEAAKIIQKLAQGITDETLRSRFLAGPQIHPVLQHAHRLATSIPDDHIEQSGL